MILIIFIDIPTYNRILPFHLRKIIYTRLKYENSIITERIGDRIYRPQKFYSRGLLQVATKIKSLNINVMYFICRNTIDLIKIKENIKNADYIALTALTPTISLVSEICRYAKKCNHKIITIIGGPHSNTAGKATLEKYSEIDFAVIGPGEHILPMLIKNIKCPDQVPNIIYRSDNGSILRSHSFNNDSLIEFYSPDYNLLPNNVNQYSHNIRIRNGCPFKCSFCVESISNNFNNNPIPIVTLINELNFLYKRSKEGTIIHFSDSVFHFNRDYFDDLCKCIKKYSDKFIYSIDTRADLLDYYSITRMIKSGIKFFRFGFEDSNNEILEKNNKSLSFEEVIEKAKLLRSISQNIVLYGYWITGLPGSTRRSLFVNTKRIQQLVRKRLIDKISNKIFVPYPGTECYSDPRKFDMKILNKDWYSYDRLSFPVYSLKGLSAAEIYYFFIFTEWMLTKSYKKVAGDSSAEKTDIIDFTYSCYVNKDDI